MACPARTRCTAVGATGFDSPRMLVEDLSGGRWHATVLSRKAVNPGNLGLDDVSCRAPRVCSAVTRYISVANDTLTWAITSRGRTGGFRFQLLPGTVAFDDPRDLSCSAHGCTLVGGKRSSDGRGGQFDIGIHARLARYRHQLRAASHPAAAGDRGRQLTLRPLITPQYAGGRQQ